MRAERWLVKWGPLIVALAFAVLFYSMGWHRVIHHWLYGGPR